MTQSDIQAKKDEFFLERFNYLSHVIAHLVLQNVNKNNWRNRQIWMLIEGDPISVYFQVL